MTAVVQAFSVVLALDNEGTVTGTEPAGTVNGDLLVAILTTDGAGETITANTPGDWTDITGMLDANAVGGRAFYHRRGAGAPDLVFNNTSAEDMVCGILRIDSHIAAGDPIDVQTTGSGSTVSPISPDALTTVDDVLVIRAFCGDRDRITTDVGYPAGMANEHYVRETRAGGNGCSQGAADEVQALDGLVGAATWTNCFAIADGWHGITIGIKPAAPAVVYDAAVQQQIEAPHPPIEVIAY